MSLGSTDLILRSGGNVPSFADWERQFSSPGPKNLKRVLRATEFVPMGKRKSIDDVMVPFFRKMQAIEEGVQAQVRLAIKGAVDLSKLDMNYQEAFCTAMGIRELPPSATLVSHKEIFKKYVTLLSNEITAKENHPFQQAKVAWLRANVLRVHAELDQIAVELEKILPLVTEAFLTSFQDFHRSVKARFENKPKVPYVILHECNQLKNELAKIERTFEEKIFSTFAAIRTLKNNWTERSDFFTAQYRYNFFALQQLQEMKDRGETEGVILMRDIITSKQVRFQGSIEELEQEVLWVKTFYSLIAEVEALFLTILKDGILKEYKELYRQPKEALDDLTRKI